MDRVNLRGVDLNLLVLLRALLEEGHVSRAAQRAGLSQSAMSNALDRCRQTFGDPLLERSGRAMQLTPRAEALREPLARVLADVGRIVADEPVPLEAIERRVGIVLADVLAAVLVRPLLAAVRARAPGISLSFHAWASGATALDRVRAGRAELAVSVLPPTPPGEFGREVVMEEQYLLAGRSGHPVLIDGSVEAWLGCDHVVVSAEGTAGSPVDDALAAAGLERRVGVTVPSFLLVADLLRGTDLLALVPSLALAGDLGAGLATGPPPRPVPGFRLDLAWHARSAADPAVRFVADTLRETLRAAAGPQQRDTRAART